MTIRRRMTRWLLILTRRVLPASARQWHDAMRDEVSQIADDREALRWAAGCLLAAGKARLGGLRSRLTAPAAGRGLAMCRQAWQDVCHALRLIRRQPVFAGLTIGTLGIGIAAATAIFTICDRMLVQPLPYPDPDRIVSVRHTGLAMSRTSGLTVANEVMALPELAAIGMYAPGALNLGDNERSERIRAAPVTAGFFHALGVAPILGRTFTPDEDQAAARVAVISATAWRQWLGGGTDLTGREVRLNSRSFTVVGVMPDGFSFPAGARVWIAAGSDYQITGAAFAPRLVARLAPAVSPDQARAALVRLEEARRPPGASPDTRAVTVTPLKAELVGGVRPTMWFLAAIVGVLLLVTCANVAGLLMSRLRVRHREFQLRTALGAGRGRLVRQLLAESLVLALVGGVVGLTLSGWAVRSYAAVATVPVPDIALDAIDLRFFAIGATMCLVSVLLFAIAPALSVGRRPAASGLREAATPGRHGRWLAHGLVVGQVAGAVLLLAATSAALAGAIRLARVETGITNDRVVLFEVELPMSRYADAAAASTLVDRFAERLAGHPDVARVGASDFAPGATHIGASTVIKYCGAPDPAPDTRRYASSLVATPGYFGAMGIGLLAGRTFDADDGAGSPRVAVVSASAARVLEPSGADVVGRQIPDLWGRPPQPVEIIGVVADVRLHFLSEGEGPQIYVPLAQQAPSGPLAIAVDAARSPSAALEAVRSALAEIDGELPLYNVTPFADLRTRYARTKLLTAEVSGIFGAIALALCAIGLYGVMSQAVAQRTRDIGIRMALGADRGTLRRQVVLHGLALAAAGTVVGAGCSLALSNAMTRFVPGLTPPTASLIAVDVAILLLVAAAAAWVPARRASAVDPIVALRAE